MAGIVKKIVRPATNENSAPMQGDLPWNVLVALLVSHSVTIWRSYTSDEWIVDIARRGEELGPQFVDKYIGRALNRALEWSKDPDNSAEVRREIVAPGESMQFLSWDEIGGESGE